MKKETNLTLVKSVAKALLMTDLQTTKLSPMVVSHPFTNTGIIALKGTDDMPLIPMNLTTSKEDFAKWQLEKAKIINEATTPFQIFFMLNPPYYLTFLKYAENHLSKKDFSEMLSNAWILSEMPNRDKNVSKGQLVEMFKRADPSVLMEPAELACFQGLDATVTVYRGVTPYNEKNLKSLSWTVNLETAQWFAHRFGEQGKVYQATIAKEHILAYFNGRNESEVIVEPKYLQGIALNEELTFGAAPDEGQETIETEGMGGMNL